MHTKESLTALKSRVEKVEVGGDYVFIRSMSVAERDTWEQLLLKSREGGKVSDKFRASLLVRCICDENGKRLFEDSDIDCVANLPADDGDRLYDVGARLAGITKEAVEEIAKN